MNRLSFSVVINTYNRAQLLRNAIASLLRLRHPCYEIVVVNGPSNDDTEVVLKEFEQHIKIRDCPEANLGKSRNIGVAASAGDIVAFMDDDATAEPNWLCELESAYADPNVCAAGGFTRDHTGYGFQWKYMVCGWVADARSFDDRHAAGLDGDRTPDGFLYPSGVNSSFRRSMLLEVGGFDEFYAFLAEESDLILRLIARGYKVCCAPAAQVHHRFAPSHIRSEDHVPRSFLPASRSHGYFAARHAVPKLGLQATLANRNQHLSRELSYVSRLLADRRIDQHHAERLTRELTDGLREGFYEGLRDSNPRVRQRAELDTGTALKPVKKMRDADRVLRICFITEELPPARSGGIGVWTLASARGLAAAGHEVTIVTPSLSHTTVDFEEGVWVHRIQRRRFPGRRGPEMPEVHPGLRDYLMAVRDEVLRIHAVRGLHLVSAPLWNVEGMALMATGELPVSLSLHTPLKAIIADRPDWQRDRDQMHWVNSLVAAEQWSLQRAERILANSDTIVAEIENLYSVALDPERLAIVHHGLADVTELGERPKNKGEDLMVLFVGRQEPRKGIDLLLQAIPGLAERFPHLRFMLAGAERPPPGGDVTYTEAFRRQYADAAWLDRVEFRGFVSDDERDALYRECDIFVAPSRFESFGLVYLEAMRFGKPVVACRAGAVVEVIEDGITGRLVAPEDPAQLVAAVADLVASPAKRAAIGTAARESFLRRFTLSHMTAGHEKAFFALYEHHRNKFD